MDRILVVIPVILCIVGISVHNSKSSTSLLVFFVINTIIFSILVGSRKSSLAEVDMASPLLPSFFEVAGEAQGGFLENATYDKVDESNDGYHKSLFNIEDESVDNVDEITTQEQEESDDNLKTRIESFIVKVYKGWIEESYWDKYGIDM
ncbi:hypothetical protein AAZX31_17G131800 [Glycine max]|uniref:Uncharacterized protein n=1 Tax=Glycine soja TaxID=3848 RepID=A0A445G6G9_GLYSO|nr:hypothetical protein GLYMA_17G136150v4 [Glycine max]KHN09768.1 hypothetical protein glysoja_017069 [Glycine soja]KAG4943262.1 hypothetical protein JHK85_047908 [Glycine max]KAG5097578.1 hypothetical protein JHK82_047432 [Glycine max]KAG5102369.1 hypothetical protein JHK84_047338 [Glycine max]